MNVVQLCLSYSVLSTKALLFVLRLLQEGGLFTFGNGSKGQLGHDSTRNEPLPRRVMELMGTEVSQIACGR